MSKSHSTLSLRFPTHQLSRLRELASSANQMAYTASTLSELLEDRDSDANREQILFQLATITSTINDIRSEFTFSENVVRFASSVVGNRPSQPSSLQPAMGLRLMKDILKSNPGEYNE